MGGVSDAAVRPAGLRCRPAAQRLGPGPDPGDVLRRLAGARGLVCLTGSWAGGGALITSEPVHVLAAGADPMAALGEVPAVEDADPRVVGGGWFGWFGYDGPSALAFYDHLLRRDADGDWWFEALWSPPREDALRARRAELAAVLAGPTRPGAPWRVGEFAGASMQRHLRAVERAVELIRAGEIYQVNVCTRLAADVSGDAAELFAGAVGALRPAFGAYVDGGDAQVVSLSPELFLRRRGRDVRTSPIKGTWPRTDAADDADEGAELLRASAKDAAENVMIVDLMRNDLGRVCETGTVRAAGLLDVEAHPGVWHLVSTVAGRLRDGVGDDDLLRATFPPGSVTGTPKLRAVEAIADLEDGPRGTYTGAIGFASPSWGLELSVAIRTFEVRDGRVELGVGGGVTADSVPMLEWHECLHKARPLLGALGARLDGDVATEECRPTREQLDGGLLETMLAVDGMPLRAADHLARLDRSCRELYRAGLPMGVLDEVLGAARVAGPGRTVIRVVVTPDLAVTVTAAAAPPRRVATAACTVRGRRGLWRHKWADRRYLAGVEAGSADAVPLFVADDGTVLETSRGNVFLLAADGSLVTPPLRDDLLPGVTRRAVLDLARDAGLRTDLRPFGLPELLASAAFWTSSVSGAVVIASVDGVALPRLDGQVAALTSLLGGESTLR